MTRKLTTKLFILTLISTAIYAPVIKAQNRPNINIEGNVTITNSPPPPTGQTRFICIPYGNGQFASAGQKPGGQPVPLIIWTPEGSKYFGQNYPPQTRCEIVSSKLDAAVQDNGGSMRNLMLTHGVVNKEVVICVLGPRENSCHAGNLLFTLKPSNANKVGEILGQLMQTSRYGSSAGVIHETSSQTYVSLEDWEKNNLQQTNNSPTQTTVTSPSQSTPSTQPIPTPPPTPQNNGDWSL